MAGPSTAVAQASVMNCVTFSHSALAAQVGLAVPPAAGQPPTGSGSAARQRDSVHCEQSSTRKLPTSSAGDGQSAQQAHVQTKGAPTSAAACTWWRWSCSARQPRSTRGSSIISRRVHYYLIADITDY